MNSIKLLKVLAVIALMCLTHLEAYSQANALCGNATPICTGIPVNYPAATNAGSAPSGPSYGCLGSEPNPAFFFLQMSTSGPVVISMSALHDIDFICWGPYPSMAGVCTNLGSSYIQSCSYSPSATETCNISNAVAGAFYVLMITNFSNQQQQINFNQTNGSAPGAGNTNCGVVCGIALNNSGAICSGQSNTLTAITTGTSVSSYTISGPTGVISSNTLAAIGNTFTNVVPNITSSGNYTFLASTGSGTCQTTSSVTVIQYPTFSVTPSNPSICQGGNLTASVTFTSSSVSPSNYFYNWSGSIVSGNFATPSPGPGIFSPGAQSTVIYPSQISGSSATVLYNVIVTPTALNCPTTNTMLLTINNPVTPTLNLPPPLCSTNTPVQLTATPSGGTWSMTPSSAALSPSGLFYPSSAPNSVNSVLYSVAVGTCNVYSTGTVTVAYYNPASLTSSVSTFCSTLDPVFDLMGIVQNTTGAWSGLSVTNNSFNPSGLPTGTYGLTYSIPSTPSAVANVCPSTTVLVVPVYHPPTPVITPIPEICNNAAPVQLTVTPSGNGVWTSNSNAVSALTGILSPTTIANSGTYNAVYTAGQGTCVVASAPMPFVIVEFHTAALTGSLSQLCANSNPVNLLSITQNTLGHWNGIGIFPGAPNSFNPNGLLSDTYTLTYTNPSSPAAYATLCPDTRTLAVSVLNPPYASITQVGPYCNTNGAVQLTVTPNSGTWTPSPYLTSGGVFTPSLGIVGNNLVQYVIGTNTCNTQQTASISVEAFVPATIASAIPDQCTTNMPLNLQPLTLSNQGSWSGPGVLGANFDPSLAGTGTVTLTYHTASSPSGLCPDQSTVSVHVYSLATPVISQVGPFCTSGLPVRLGVSPVGGVFGGANTNAVDATGLFTPASARIGSNIINYSITSGPCLAYAQTTISIEKFVPADFIATAGPFCKNDPRLVRNLNELVLNPGGQWYVQGMPSNGIFTFTNATIGSNTIIHGTHSEPTATLCPDTKTTEIVVYDTPQVSIVPATPLQGCAPLKVELNTPSVNSGEGAWNFSDGSVVTGGLTSDHIFNSPGTYSVVFSYSAQVAADLACVTQNTLGPIRVFDAPQPDFTVPEEIMISDPAVQLNNTSASVEHYQYQWTISGNGLSETLYEIDPLVVFPNVGDYKVTLSATSLNNCKAQVSKVISVKAEFNVYIPSSFTPNGDGLNDYFYPVFTEYGLDDTGYELDIFDRWGTVIFQTKDRTQGWDGKRSGQPVKQDVYVYKLRYKDLNGNVYNKTGYVTVLR